MRVGLLAPALALEHGGIWQFAQWVAAHVGPAVPLHLMLPGQALAEIARSPDTTTADTDQLLAVARARALHRAWRRAGLTPLARRLEAPALIRSLASAGVDVVHVPVQRLAWPDIARRYPYVLNPHDYQHEHLPEFFTFRQRTMRRLVWYPSQRAAAALVVHARQTRDDAIRYLRVPEERVIYAPYGPLATFPEPDDALRATVDGRLGMPQGFVFYPARMWGHKNHLALLEALALLKHRGIAVGCVFTGGGPAAAEVKAAVDRLGLSGQVRTLGYVSATEMGALYRLATMVVVPSLFEQNSGPMLEAIEMGKAVAVSHLPELVHSLGGAGLVFDPRSPREIAEAIDRVVSSDAARNSLEASARTRRAAMSWEPFIEAYRAAYSLAAGR